jgi:DNA primase
MSSSVEKIKERLSIVDVISSYIQVEQSGKNFKAKCPFHNEKTPSFFISTDRNSYYCFGCGEKGDIFSFVEKFEGTDFLGSLKLLAERAGIKLESRDRNDKEIDKKELYYEILEEATKFFEVNFNNEPSARSYLLNRGITDTTIKSFRIGYVKEEWRSVSDYLISKGYKREDLEIVGLTKKSEGGYYDRFRGRIMFPLSDSSGRVIAFSGRIFSNVVNPENSTQSEAKYLNSPDTPLFNKSNVLFGIDKAKNSIRKNGYSIIVEGQMDLVLSHQVGLTNTVAVSGTAFADNTIDNESKINNLGLIRRLSSNIIFAYDGDSAGIRAASKSAMIALSLDMQVKIAILPEGKDPADIIKDNPKQWESIIKNSVDIITFHADRICQSTNDIRVRGKLVRETIFPFISMIKNSTDKFSYLSTVCSKTGLKSNVTTEDFEIYNRSHNTSNNPENKNNNPLKKEELVSRRDNLEKRLFGIIFWQNKDDSIIKVENIYNSLEERIGKEEFSKISELKEPFRDILAFEAEMWYGDKIKDLTRDVEEIMLSLEEEILNERLILLLDKINQKGNGVDDFDPGPILVDYQKAVERIEKIKSYRFQ